MYVIPSPASSRGSQRHDKAKDGVGSDIPIGYRVADRPALPQSSSGERVLTTPAVLVCNHALTKRSSNVCDRVRKFDESVIKKNVQYIRDRSVKAV